MKEPFKKQWFNDYIFQHDQGILEYSSDEDGFAVAERAFEAGYQLAVTHFNPFTGCKCKLYTSETYVRMENNVRRLEEVKRDLKQQIRLLEHKLKVVIEYGLGPEDLKPQDV